MSNSSIASSSNNRNTWSFQSKAWQLPTGSHASLKGQQLQPQFSHENFNSVSDSLNQFQSNKSLGVQDEQVLIGEQMYEEANNNGAFDDQYLKELEKMPWMKKRKRGQSAKNNLASISFYGGKVNYKNQKKLQKESLLTNLQQSRKEIMIQRLELHNMRD